MRWRWSRGRCRCRGNCYRCCWGSNRGDSGFGDRRGSGFDSRSSLCRSSFGCGDRFGNDRRHCLNGWGNFCGHGGGDFGLDSGDGRGCNGFCDDFSDWRSSDRRCFDGHGGFGYRGSDDFSGWGSCGGFGGDWSSSYRSNVGSGNYWSRNFGSNYRSRNFSSNYGSNLGSNFSSNYGSNLGSNFSSNYWSYFSSNYWSGLSSSGRGWCFTSFSGDSLSAFCAFFAVRDAFHRITVTTVAVAAATTATTAWLFAIHCADFRFLAFRALGRGGLQDAGGFCHWTGATDGCAGGGQCQFFHFGFCGNGFVATWLTWLTRAAFTTLSTLAALGAFCTLGALRTFRTLCTFGTLSAFAWLALHIGLAFTRLAWLTWWTAPRL